MDLGRRWLVLAMALFLVAACASLEQVAISTPAIAATLSARPHPSPTPAPTPKPTPTPRPTPQPTPPPTPPATPPPTPPATPPPTPPPTDAPSVQPSALTANDQTGSNTPFTGLAVDGSARAMVIGPTAHTAGAVDAVPSDTENLFMLIIVVALAVPGFLLMTLIATVLIRR